MIAVKHSVRLSPGIDAALRQAAAARKSSAYQVLQLAVRTGLSCLCNEQGDANALAEITRELGAMSARLARVERVAERGLFVSCSAYAFARAAAGTRADDTTLSEQINAAFARQMQIIGDQP